MSRRRVLSAAGGTLRAQLAAKLRVSAARWYDLEPGMREADPAGWLEKADELDAGRPVVLRGWELPHGTLPRGHSWDDYRLEPDGSLTPVRAVLGDAAALTGGRLEGPMVVGWEPL